MSNVVIYQKNVADLLATCPGAKELNKIPQILKEEKKKEEKKKEGEKERTRNSI